jgi:hypothetical protein
VVKISANLHDMGNARKIEMLLNPSKNPAPEIPGFLRNLVSSQPEISHDSKKWDQPPLRTDPTCRIL